MTPAMTPAHAAPALRWALLVLSVAGVLALAGLSARHAQALKAADCPPARAGEVDIPLSASSLELAGSAERARWLLLHPIAPADAAKPAMAAAAATAAEWVCLEARVRHVQAEFQALDAGVFMPLYALMALLVTASAQAGPGARRRGLPIAAAVAAAVAGSTAVLLVLDARENHQTLALLDALWEATWQGGTAVADTESAARAARAASLGKWAAAALWSLALAWAMWRGWPWAASAPLAGGRSSAWRRAVSTVLRVISTAAFGIAALALGGMAAWGWARPQALAPLLQAIDWGMGAAITGLVLAVGRAWWAGWVLSANGPIPPSQG